jgi:hypothetical protein
MRALLLILGAGGLAAYAFKGRARPNVAGVRAATGASGASYEVFRRGGGSYEVVLRDEPTVWIMFGQKGETGSSGDEDALATMRADMQTFPRDLFA